MTIVLSGVAVGVVAAMALMRLLRSFIYGVGVWDPITFVPADSPTSVDTYDPFNFCNFILCS
jgi:hypothetical protein